MATISAMSSLSASTFQGAKVNTVRSSVRTVAVRTRTTIRATMDVEAPAPPPPAPKWSETMAGGSSPMGAKWDPLNFLEGKDENQIKLYREAELTHGRVAMLASLGFVVGESFNPLFGGSITGLAINHFQQVPGLFWSAIVFSIACAEGYRLTTGWSTKTGWGLNEDYIPGDLGFDPMGLKPTNAADLASKSTKELNNGRLAMLAIAGMVGQELATGEKLF